MKISVVIPTYRRPPLLAKCLQALYYQSFDINGYEVIVVSDGPDEETQQTVAGFARMHMPIRFLQLPQKKGPAAARNMGWQHATGILIAFTDDDTIPDKDWLSNIWKAYDGTEKIAYTGKIKVPLSNSPTDYEKNTAGLETADFVTANCICTKKALEIVGGFDERFSMAWREDSDLEFKLLHHHIPIIRHIEAWVVHPVRQAPWGISIKEQKKSMFNALLYKKFPQLYRSKIQRHPKWNYYIMVLSILLLLAGLIYKLKGLSIIAFICWLFLSVQFIWRRLSTTSKNTSHILEMIVTSIIIPFVSVYWRLYGAWKYRVLFL